MEVAETLYPGDPGYLDWRQTQLARIERLNRVTLTIDQLERGYETFMIAGSRAPMGGYGEAAITALREFCEAEGLTPAEDAVEAILLRWEEISEAASLGIDLKASDPALYARCATAPIDPSQIGIWDDEEEYGTIPWADKPD